MILSHFVRRLFCIATSRWPMGSRVTTYRTVRISVAFSIGCGYWSAVSPRSDTRRTNSQIPTHQLDGNGLVAPFNHSVCIRNVLAKDTAHSHRESCSLVTWAIFCRGVSPSRHVVDLKPGKACSTCWCNSSRCPSTLALIPRSVVI